MALLLDIPYEEKDEAKALGAKWNPNLKKWYISEKRDYYKFAKWILGDKDDVTVICDYIYIVVGERLCFKCNKPKKVIGFGIENRIEFYNQNVYDNIVIPYEYYGGVINIASMITPLPSSLFSFLADNFGYYIDFSKISGRDYFNHCSNCGVLQGNFHIFEEVDSPFFIDSIDKAKNLTLYRINLKYDFIADAMVGCGSHDFMIKEYAEIFDIDNFFEI